MGYQLKQLMSPVSPVFHTEVSGINVTGGNLRAIALNLHYEILEKLGTFIDN